ncbi:MAG: transposase [Gemmatimonadetes bacterium]|nr:transposase [Gemmatimonadota bacterium]
MPEEDRAFATRLARYCAWNPVALERLTSHRGATAVTYRSDKSEGPTAGTETADPLAFLARVLVHIPDKGQVTTRYYGWYANRPRGMRGKAASGRRITQRLSCGTLMHAESTCRVAARLQAAHPPHRPPSPPRWAAAPSPPTCSQWRLGLPVPSRSVGTPAHCTGAL